MREESDGACMIRAKYIMKKIEERKSIKEKGREGESGRKSCKLESRNARVIKGEREEG